MILDAGYWAGHTVYPETKLTKERFANIFFEFGVERMTVNSSGDWGKSDPMAVVKTAAHIERLGGDPAQIQKLVWDNPVAFYGKERLALPEGEEKVFA
jgi:predicted metal-dependent TIM-barrel fold hydrolase